MTRAAERFDTLDGNGTCRKPARELRYYVIEEVDSREGLRGNDHMEFQAVRDPLQKLDDGAAPTSVRSTAGQVAREFSIEESHVDGVNDRSSLIVLSCYAQDRAFSLL